MKEETKRWLEKAKSDLKQAKDNVQIKNYDLASFLSQQSTEKALKAYQLQREETFSKTHDILFLAKRLGLPGDLLEKCDKLNPVYIETRYPDASGQFEEFTKEESLEDIRIAEEVLAWIETHL
ncbi:MAG: HEPN domain-containing protein [Candidatus Auribacterota bacterium]